MWNPLDSYDGTAQAPLVTETVDRRPPSCDCFDATPTEAFLVSAIRLASKHRDQTEVSDSIKPF